MVDERFEYYNRRRRHSSIGYRRPEKYAKEKLKSGENIDPKPWLTLALTVVRKCGARSPVKLKESANSFAAKRAFYPARFLWTGGLRPPPGDLVAQPVKPERLNLMERFLSGEGQHCLSKIIPEAPNRSQKVVSVLKRPVIITINRAPFWVIGIVQKESSKLCVPGAFPNDDLQRLWIHVVLFPGHFHVHVTFKKGYDIHLGSPARSDCYFTASTATANFGQESPHCSAPADLRLARRRFGFVFIPTTSGARILS